MIMCSLWTEHQWETSMIMCNLWTEHPWETTMIMSGPLCLTGPNHLPQGTTPEREQYISLLPDSPTKLATTFREQFNEKKRFVKVFTKCCRDCCRGGFSPRQGGQSASAFATFHNQGVQVVASHIVPAQQHARHLQKVHAGKDSGRP